MPRLAFFTIAILNSSPDDSAVAGFFQRTANNFSAAASTEGFIASAATHDIPGVYDWGSPSASESVMIDEDLSRAQATLSLWQDLESVFSFAYHDVHAEALRHRHDWFLKPRWPTYVAWWVADDHVPTWQEAADRHTQLHTDGSTPQAFDFKTPYTAAGQPATIDRKIVQQKAADRQERALSET